MDIEMLREFCLKKKGTEECFPFDSDTLAFKVMGKIYLLTGISADPLQFNVKCDPELAIEYRETYDYVKPGYHMNKKHWNTVHYNGSNTKILLQMIDHSYSIVVAQLSKSQKEALAAL